MTARRRLCAVWALAAVCALPAPAHAGIEDSVGLGPRAIALGGSYAARPGDFAAVYYNPAGLSPGGDRADHGGFVELSLGVVAAHPVVHATREDGTNLALAAEPEDTRGVFIGTRFSLGRPFGIDGLNMGVSLYVPRRLFFWNISPDDKPQFAMLSDRTQVLSFHSGLSYALTRWLSLGVGLRALFDAQTYTRGEVTEVSPAVDPETGRNVVRTNTRLGVESTVFGRVSPLLGVLLTPLDALSIGVSYRHESLVDDWGNTRISGVPSLGNLGYTHRYAHYFEPSQLTLAVAWRISPELMLSADLTFNRWSRGLSTNRNFFGEGRFGDTWTPAAGLSYRTGSLLSVMLGYRFWRSPLDNLGGPSNLLDNDRHVLSSGLELDLGAPLPESSMRLALTAALQYQLFVEREEHKDFRRFKSDQALRDNPGYPGYHYGGQQLGGSLGIEARW